MICIQGTVDIMKYKTIKISEKLHTELKNFCNAENLKLNKWCEDVLIGELKYAKEYARIKNVDKKLSKMQ